jgi:ribosomal protein S18 acetylase RimI-like enzyme
VDGRLASLRRADRDALMAILRATSVFSPEEIDVAVSLFDDAIADDDDVQSTAPPASSNYAFLGAFTPEDELAGFACYGPTPDTDRTWDLYWIAVDPAHGRAGFATQLLAEVERRLLGHKARLVVVETSSRSEYAPARSFYSRRGYAEQARVPGFYAPGDDRIILTKRIESPSGRGVPFS